MKNAKIVLVAEWDGWCGACAADRPLVLTRTGRQRVRTWLTGADDDSRPLLLTCRLCGTGVDVPPERDDPPVTVSLEELAVPEPADVVPVADVVSVEPAAAPGMQPVPGPVAQPVAVPVVVPSVVAAATDAEGLRAGHQAVARALGGLLAQRSADAAVPAPAPVPVRTPVVAPALPLQRTSASGRTELQLLADGIDLLSTGRG